MSRWIDIDDDRNCYIGNDGQYEKWNIDPDVLLEDVTKCQVCENLEFGDTLYVYSDWDGGIGFDYIRNIKYCPVCGRRL